MFATGASAGDSTMRSALVSQSMSLLEVEVSLRLTEFTEVEFFLVISFRLC